MSKLSPVTSGSMMESFKFLTATEAAAGYSSSETIQKKKERLDAAIHENRRLPVLEERENPLQFWLYGWDMSSSATNQC